MGSNNSNLSSSKYGYDFVVATTQESINSGLKQYLKLFNQPTLKLSFLVDRQGNPAEYISLDQLKEKVGDINPFDIPDKTDPNDPRIRTLTQNRFAVGLKIKVGLPSGIRPKDLLPIVELGTSADNVIFNLFTSEFQVVQNTPPGGWDQEGSWQVWSQSSQESWHFSTKVNLVYSALNKKLETPYFSNHPEQKVALLNQLKNLSANSFSLRQLLFDLDNAALQTMPSIEGLLTGSSADSVLSKYFTRFYFEAVKKHGEPVLAVHAEVPTPDKSSLRLTAKERQVSQFVDGNGVPVSDPTREQKQATTLCYLCAVNNNPLPAVASFNWNWVDPEDIVNKSGEISINRNTLANFYKNRLIEQVKQSCIKVSCNVKDPNAFTGEVTYEWTLTPGETPTEVKITESGSDVLVISYESRDNGHARSGATAGALELHTPFECRVSFSGNKIKIVQNLKVWCSVRWDATKSKDGNIFDRTITDTYTLSVDQHGALKTDFNSEKEDHEDDVHRSEWVDFWTDINHLVDGIKKEVGSYVSQQITDIPAENIQNFIFPGANVFTYKDVKFSEHQDLLCSITYTTPHN